jgi:hypothetical protein
MRPDDFLSRTPDTPATQEHANRMTDPTRPVEDVEWLPTTPEELRVLVRTNPDLFNRLVDEGRITSAVLSQPDAEPAPVVEPAPEPVRPASFDGGAQRQRPPAASFADYRDLARTNPTKFNEMVDAGLISPTAR